MVGSMQVRVIHLCGGGQLRMAEYAWGVLTSNHAQKEEMHHHLRQQFFSDPTQWRDYRRRKPTRWHPDFKPEVDLRLDNRNKPVWVKSQVSTWDAEISGPPHSKCTSVEEQGAVGRLRAHERNFEVGMCKKLCEDGPITAAVDALNLLVQLGCPVPKNLFYRVLKRCKDLILGRRIHALTVEGGHEGDAFLATHLINLYASHGKLEEATKVFTDVSIPDAYNWATVIFAHARQGEPAQAIWLYRQMRKSAAVKPDNRIYVSVLKACATAGDLVAGKEVHGHILAGPGKPDIFVETGLVEMYAKCGNLEEARSVFDRILDRNVVIWTVMIASYVQEGMGREALSLYLDMQLEGLFPPDSVTYVCLLQACAIVGVEAMDQGQQLHVQIEEQGLLGDVVLCGSLVHMYAKCGRLGDARSLFERLPDRNVVIWTTMIAGYVQHGMGQEALWLHSRMQQEGLTPPVSITYTCLLQACASVGVAALDHGKLLHAEVEERGLHNDAVVSGSLVNMYAKCGSLDDARRVFDILPARNVLTWNAMITAYAQQELGEEALSLYSSMQQEGLALPDSVAVVSVLQACAIVGVGALDQGKQLHAQIEERGLHNDVILGGGLVNMYAKCGSLEDARSLFDRLLAKNVITWTAMMAGYAQRGMGQEALTLYCSMQQEGIAPPNSVTFLCLLQACACVGVGALQQGQRLHAQIEERGQQDDLVLGGGLVNMYAKCGSLEDVRKVFERLPDKNVVTWTAMIAGYVQQGLGQEALTLYTRMQEEGITPPDSITFVCLLQACASVGVGALHHGKQLHANIEERELEDDLVLSSSLVNMYAKCGCLEDAYSLFERLPEKNVVTWTAMIAGYVQQGMCQEAITLYAGMEEKCMTPPDSVTFVCLLQACAIVGVEALHHGKQLHARIVEQGLQDDVVLGGSLVNMYVKCCSLEDARNVFERLSDKNVVTWTAMIAGYAQQGMCLEALNIYTKMQREGITPPDSVTFVCLLQACASAGVGALDQGRQLHAQIEDQGLQDDVVLAGSLVNMYAKCGDLGKARSMFDQLPARNVVPWTAMIAGYTQQGMGQEALNIYCTMQQEGIITPNSATFVCLLQACASLAALPQGMQLHAHIEEQGLHADPGVGAALVNMYAKCGSMFDSQNVFASLPERTIEAWNALTSGYSRQGNSDVVFDLLDAMRLAGIQPDGITFVSVLTVCSRVGLVDKGREYFEAMRIEYGISPAMEHYICMLDLLGRAGHLIEALQMAKSMPFPPDGLAWLVLLGACQKWKNVEIGQEAMKFAGSLDGKLSAPYVLMSNIYADAEMWEEAMEIHARRVKSRAWKQPGRSWCSDMGGLVHTFLVGDKKHVYNKGEGV